MNSKVAKYLKRQADDLPEVKVKKVVVIKCKGSEIPEEKIKPGDDIDPSCNYKYRTEIYETVDHYSKMKAMHKTKGQQGVINYCAAVRKLNVKGNNKMEVK